VLEIAEREAIATSVGWLYFTTSCMSSLCAHRKGVCRVLRVACGRGVVPGQGRFLWCGRQVGVVWAVTSQSVICSLDSFQRRAWDRGLIARAFVQA
jgi:hypothetical protein